MRSVRVEIPTGRCVPTDQKQPESPRPKPAGVFWLLAVARSASDVTLFLILIIVAIYRYLPTPESALSGNNLQ
jgi:hypothetical protein